MPRARWDRRSGATRTRSSCRATAITAAGGKVGGFSATGGVDTKLRLLELEGTALPADAAVHRGRRLVDVGRRRRRAAAGGRPGAAPPDRPGRLVRRSPPRRTSSVFAALLEAIVLQQLSGKAAATIHARVLALAAGHPRRAPGPTRSWRCPTTRCRGAGLSQAKLRGRARPRAAHGRRLRCRPCAGCAAWTTRR